MVLDSITRAGRMHRVLVGLTLAMLASVSNAQSFPISVDATALSVSGVSLSSYGVLPPGAAVSALLPVGSHSVSHPSFPGTAQVTFSVTPAGTVSYDSGLEGVLAGAGTTTLVVNGAAVSIDASALSVYDANLFYTGISLHTPVTLHLLPGGYTIEHVSFPSYASIGFTIAANGTFAYSPVSEGLLAGAGTAALTVNGASVSIDASALSVYDANLFYTGISLHTPVTLHLLPGGYTIEHVSFPSYASIGFTIAANGTFAYSPVSEGLLVGAGTAALTVNGASVSIDASALSVYDANLFYTGISLHTPVTLHLLPGGYTIEHVSFPSYASIGFSVTANGTVSYDPIHEGLLLGAGSSALVAVGAQIAVDASLLSPVDVNLYYTGISLEAAATLNLLPGAYAIHYVSYPSGVTAAFQVGASGLLGYDPALEGVMTGSGTTSLGVPGAGIKIAMGSLGADVQLNYVGVFPACSLLHLLPGVHSIPAGPFTVLGNGTVDFAPSLDPVLSGRGTATLSLRQPSGFPADCSNPPTAVAGPDQHIHVGSVVQLDGSGSFDDNTPTADLRFIWSFVTRPAGSTAVLSDVTVANPTFTADRPGDYEIRLVVIDTGEWSSAPDTVIVSSENLTPTANAGQDASVAAGTGAALDGSGSTDPDLDPLTYSWVILDRPLGSLAIIQTSSPTVSSATLATDLVGTYLVGLTVSDGFGVSTVDEVVITALAVNDFAQILLASAQSKVLALPNSDVSKPGNRDRLARMIADATSAVQASQIAKALKLIDDALQRVDGCALRGTPDLGGGSDRDWVTTCGAQGPIYLDLMAARQALSP